MRNGGEWWGSDGYEEMVMYGFDEFTIGIKWQIREYDENTAEDPQLHQWNIRSCVGQIYEIHLKKMLGHLSFIAIQYWVPVYGLISMTAL